MLLIGLPIYFVIKFKGTVFVKRREHSTPFKTRFLLFAAFDSAKQYRKQKPIVGNIDIFAACVTSVFVRPPAFAFGVYLFGLLLSLI